MASRALTGFGIVAGAALLATGLVAGGCSGAAAGSADYVHMSEVTLSDGTHCAIADYHGTGISCDWRTQK